MADNMAIYTVLKDKLGKILDPLIPRYEILRYDLITDGQPVKTGRKVNGKDEFVKRITLSSFPNATSKTFQTGITNGKWVRHYIYMYVSDSSAWHLLPYHSLSALNAGVNAVVSDDVSTITIQSGTDRRNLSGIAYIYFTYNS